LYIGLGLGLGLVWYEAENYDRTLLPSQSKPHPVHFIETR